MRNEERCGAFIEEAHKFARTFETLNSKQPSAIEDGLTSEPTGVRVLEHGVSIFSFLGWKRFLGWSTFWNVLRAELLFSTNSCQSYPNDVVVASTAHIKSGRRSLFCTIEGLKSAI